MEKSLNKANYKLDETTNIKNHRFLIFVIELEKLDEDTNDKLDNTDKTLKLVAKKLDIAVEDRVVKTKSNLKNESIK